MASNDAHFSGEGHLIEAEISGDPNNTVRPLVCDSTGHLLVAGGSTSSTVMIEDTAGNPITTTAGSLNVNITGGTSSPNVNVHDGSGNSISSTTGSLNVDVTNTVPVTGTFFQATQPVSGTVTAIQPTGANLHVDVDNFPATQPVSGTVAVSNFPATQPVSGTVTANQGTPNTLANGWPVEITDGTNILGTSAHPIRIDPTGTTTQPVSLTSTTITGNVTVVQSTPANLQVTATPATAQASTTSGQTGNLQMGAVTTTAPTYVTGQTDPLSLNTSGGLRVDGSGVTQPVSGTVTANAGTGTFTVAQSATLPVTLLTVGITAASSGDNTVIAGVAGKKIYVYAWNLSFSGTVNAKFTDGAGGTLFSGLYYGIVNAGGGNAVTPPNYLWSSGATGNSLVLNLSAAVAVGGSVSYWQV